MVHRCNSLSDIIKKIHSKGIKENFNDIVPALSPYTKKYDCIKCKICGSVSGTLKIITHYHNCKYKNIFSPFYFYNKTEKIKYYKINKKNSELIFQREFGIINKNSSKNIIGTIGCDTCVAICLRDSNTNTLLAHIDHNTLNPLNIFTNFNNNDCDVHIIGGNELSKDLLNKIFVFLIENNYKLKFAHIIDNKTNNFSINCINGDFIVNDKFNYGLEMTINSQKRKLLLIESITNYTNLNYVNIN